MGILKTAATVAVASSVHGRVQRRQQRRWAAQDQGVHAAQTQHAGYPAAPAAPVAATASARFMSLVAAEWTTQRPPMKAKLV